MCVCVSGWHESAACIVADSLFSWALFLVPSILASILTSRKIKFTLYMECSAMGFTSTHKLHEEKTILSHFPGHFFQHNFECPHPKRSIRKWMWISQELFRVLSKWMSFCFTIITTFVSIFLRSRHLQYRYDLMSLRVSENVRWKDREGRKRMERNWFDVLRSSFQWEQPAAVFNFHWNTTKTARNQARDFNRAIKRDFKKN